jgi:hypothetical protein
VATGLFAALYIQAYGVESKLVIRTQNISARWSTYLFTEERACATVQTAELLYVPPHATSCYLYKSGAAEISERDLEQVCPRVVVSVEGSVPGLLKFNVLYRRFLKTFFLYSTRLSVYDFIVSWFLGRTSDNWLTVHILCSIILIPSNKPRNIIFITL